MSCWTSVLHSVNYDLPRVAGVVSVFNNHNTCAVTFVHRELPILAEHCDSAADAAFGASRLMKLAWTHRTLVHQHNSLLVQSTTLTSSNQALPSHRSQCFQHAHSLSWRCA